MLARGWQVGRRNQSQFDVWGLGFGEKEGPTEMFELNVTTQRHHIGLRMRMRMYCGTSNKNIDLAIPILSMGRYLVGNP